jgi:dihydrofolate reductase
MLLRTHVGVTLDGFVAAPNGLPAWDYMPTFGAGSHGYSELMEECEAVVVGRTSFDQGFKDWLKSWPWPDKQVLGGPRTIQALMEIGALDRLGMVVLPILLREGIPLFPIRTTTFSKDARAASQEPVSRPLLRLERQRVFPDGAIELTYSPRVK